MTKNKDIKLSSASVKVMRSYDYCHFEICLSSDEIKSDQDINLLRIRAAKLTDRAVDDYRSAKAAIEYSQKYSYKRKELEQRVKAIKENFPKSEWTPEQQATIKELEDLEFHDQFEYDEDY